MDRLTLSPEMNAEIINILRLSPDDDIHQYAAQLIEEQAAQITALQGEIAELRAKLEKAVELPCEIGDTVYVITQCGDIQTRCDDDFFNGTGAVECPFENLCDCEECDNYNIVIVETTFDGYLKDGDGITLFLEDLANNFTFDSFGKTVFLTREAAESALSELERGTEK